MQSANAKLQEANKARVAAQEELKKQTSLLLEQLKRAQEDGARHLESSGAAKDELLKHKEAAQEKELELKEQMVSFKLKVSELTFNNTELQEQLDRCNKDLAACNAKLKEASDLLASSTAQSDLDALKQLMRDKDSLIADLKQQIEGGEQRLARERDALKKSRDAMYEMERRMEELEVLLARAQAEKDVSAAMVHQLMSQLSKARMDKMTMLKGSESMSVQEQHAQMQQLLMSAKQHSQQVASLVERVPHAKKEAVKKYMNDLESSRASSRQSMALADDDDHDPFNNASRDPSRAPSSAAGLGPAEAALSLDPVELPAAPPRLSAEGGGGSEIVPTAATPEDSHGEADEAQATSPDAGDAGAPDTPAPADRNVDAEAKADVEGAAQVGVAEGGPEESSCQGTAHTAAEHEQSAAAAEAEAAQSVAVAGDGAGDTEGGESSAGNNAAEGVQEFGEDAEAAATKIQAVARGRRCRAEVRAYLEGQMEEYLAANTGDEAVEGDTEPREDGAAAHPEAGGADIGASEQDQPQPAVSADEFVKPTPPASRPSSSRPTSASLRRPGGSKSNSRVNSPLPSAGGPAVPAT